MSNQQHRSPICKSLLYLIKPSPHSSLHPDLSCIGTDRLLSGVGSLRNSQGTVPPINAQQPLNWPPSCVLGVTYPALQLIGTVNYTIQTGLHAPRVCVPKPQQHLHISRRRPAGFGLGPFIHQLISRLPHLFFAFQKENVPRQFLFETSLERPPCPPPIILELCLMRQEWRGSVG